MKKIYALIRPLLLIYILLLPFPHVPAPRDTAFVIMLIIFIIKVIRKDARINLRDRTVQAFCLLFVVAILTSLIGPYPGESLDFIRKNLVYQAVVFFVIQSEYRSFDDLRGLFYTLFASFAILTALVLAFNSPSALLNWIEHADKKFASGYSLHGTFYIPLLAGFLYSARIRASLRWTLVLVLVIEFVLCVLDNHRGQTAALAVALILAAILARRYRTLVYGLVVSLVIGAVLMGVKPDMFSRYRTLVTPGTYTTNASSGWNGRFAIWSGVMDMIRERPITGYGYGWKKMATVARKDGFLERWDREKPATYEFFATRYYGSTTPHNLILQILFEGGLAGLSAFLIFWAAVFMKILPLPPPTTKVKAGGHEGAAAFLRSGATGVLVSYILVNIAWSLWEETAGVLMMTLVAICVVLHDETKRQRV